MRNPTQTLSPKHAGQQSWTRALIVNLLILIILLLAVYFRSIGVDWDAGEHLHPDERFLTMVESAIRPVDSLAAYFNTAASSLNPHNVGYTYYVYGTLPLFLVRYLADWLNQSGYGQIYLVGRQISALADVFTVFLVFLIGTRLYNRKVGLLAAAFSAFAVLQIQLSHYFTVDNITNLFTFLAIYAAVRILVPPPGRARSGKPSTSARHPAPQAPVQEAELEEETVPGPPVPLPSIWNFLLFGIGLGLAMASKVSAIPLAVLLPAALAIHFSRLDPEERQRQLIRALTYLALAALASLLIFRIFQPYAFTGPGFFGLKINPLWLQNLRDLAAQSGADSDAPYALQWARRPLTFAWTNMVQWGLGLPLGLLAWAGVAWMGWRMVRREWRQHALIWGWTIFYFTWQSISWTRSMRYQILVYPTLAIIAAWLVVWLWERGSLEGRLNKALRIAGLSLGVISLVGTFAWAFAFTRIYTRPVTRVAASEWIYQNIPAPINLRLEESESLTNVPLYYSMGERLQNGSEYSLVFEPATDNILTEISLPHVFDLNYSDLNKTLQVTVISLDGAGPELAAGIVQNPFNTSITTLGDAYTVTINSPIALLAGQKYRLTIHEVTGSGYLLLTGSPRLTGIDSTRGTEVIQSLPMFAQRITPQTPYVGNYLVPESGTLREIYFPHLVDQTGSGGEKTLRISIVDLSQTADAMVSASLSADFSPAEGDARGEGYTAVLDQPIQVTAGNTYMLMVELISGNGGLAVYGDTIGIEYPWDDPVPLGLGKYSAFDSLNMLYPPDLAFDLYTTDSPEKKNRFLNILDNADTVIITSNRQWGSIVRVPERYPMTREYYRALIGCPADEDILACYSQARPGSYTGELGYELAAVFQSNPNLGSFEINDQMAEEAFTVYDHPKVLIFRKTEGYTHENAQAILDSVDLSGVVYITPRRVTGSYKSLLLPETRWNKDQASGTWSQLFDTNNLLNRYPGVGAVVWYLAIFLLGLMVYPLVRLAMPGLSDRGYPLARMVGLLLFTWLAWLAGSAGIEVTRLLLVEIVLVLLLLGLGLAYLQRRELSREIRSRAAYFLAVELVALLFFGILLAVRIGNPDLWHVSKGGEKPMDFSYFNAVLKSASFPPYDPWYAGGYINYYYYGYVIVGMPVKLLGIQPSVAYNLILPTLFSLLALGGFSAVWNLLAWRRGFWPQPEPPSQETGSLLEALSPVEAGEEAGDEEEDWEDEDFEPVEPVGLGWVVGQRAFLAGLAGAAGLVLLGNLGTLRMLWHGLMRLAAPGGVIDGANIFNRLAWTVQGFLLMLGGSVLPYGNGDWYWIPSRAIPGEAITEFPSFTFLYADLHAHMIALPITALALVLVMSVLLANGRWGEEDGSLSWPGRLSAWLIAGVTFGALRPTNTWDFPTYLLLACLVILYTYTRYGQPPVRWLPRLPGLARRFSLGLGVVVGLVGSSLVFYAPFSAWYSQAYNSIIPWTGAHTPFWSYLTHWGVFLFGIVSWMFFETRNWMAAAPVSSLRKLQPYQVLIQGLIALVFVLVAYLTYRGIQIAWLVAFLGVWAVILILRPDQPDAKRLVLFLFGTGLVLTLFVELFVLKGDIGRMNTVFKFYLQVWTLFAVCAGAGLGWMAESAFLWRPRWTPVWQAGLTVLVFAAALFPTTAGADKVRDRMASARPLTLDGMAFMQTASYSYTAEPMDLSQDFAAIRWLQENVTGSPVIVEANLRDLYRWGSRMTIYTGLPGVVGWEWHQQQQRASQSPMLVTNRILEIEQFYRTVDPDQAKEFLQKYNVGYIIVGQLEREVYAGSGLDKFAQQEGLLWQKVYENADTVIYQTDCGCSVLPPVER